MTPYRMIPAAFVALAHLSGSTAVGQLHISQRSGEEVLDVRKKCDDGNDIRDAGCDTRVHAEPVDIGADAVGSPDVCGDGSCTGAESACTCAVDCDVVC